MSNHDTGEKPSRVQPQQIKRYQGWITWLMLLGIGLLLVGLLVPATRSAGPAARRAQCVNNLKQIALALSQYEQTYQALPPAYTVDAKGKPLHSWRTLILPFLEQSELYKKIHLPKA